MSDSPFRPAPPTIDFPANELDVLEFWRERGIFKKTEAVNRLGKYFVFYDGPPGTNGRPHIGHIMQSSLKDVWPRFKTMQGYTCLRKAGWDTHGLPVELTAEADLGLSGKADIEKFGVKRFVEQCRSTVLRFRKDWVDGITRLGRFVDLENDYLTMSNDFIQSDWWVLKQAWEKDLLYQDYKIVPYCARCGTGLSSHEVAQGYRDITDLTVTAKFRLKDEERTSVLAWTTTPWTLLGNVALAVNGSLDYAKVRISGASGEEFVILAQGTLERNRKALGDEATVVAIFPGTELVGRAYEPLWAFSAVHMGQDKTRLHEIVSDDYVTTDDGTGVVHLALYGEDDFRLIKKNGFAQNQHVLANGECGPNCGPYAGRFFREEGLDVDIVKDLAARGLLFDKYRYEHSYPHCWRCKTPLMYFAKSSWFLRTTAIKDTMLAENERINWQPPHLKSGRFGNWLENNVDWAISRERYWGTPLPIWTHEQDPARRICVASIAELQSHGAVFESTGTPIPGDIDLHIPVIDDVVIKKNDGTYRRERGTLDVWFNSGVMPWGQFGYPAKPGSREEFEGKHQFPADFICEAIDQTRGWFYTLLSVSCLVTGKSSFRNVICTELVLDASGKKMSKSLGNVIPPLPLIEKFGADAVRWTFYDSDPWQSKRYSEELPREALRAIFIPLWNCYSFFVTYARLDGWRPGSATHQPTVELDRWILSALGTLIRDVTDSLERYDIAPAATAIRDFIDALSNWYIRRSRKRFWKSDDDGDKQSAYTTLYEVLTTLCQIMAPFAPFVTEAMYQNLVRAVHGDAVESVHLTTWPDPTRFPEERALEKEMSTIQEAAALGRALRVEHDLKVRQPLSRLMVTPTDASLVSGLERHREALAEELNVKEVTFLREATDLVQLVIKPNWKALGPRLGPRMKEAGAAIQSISGAMAHALVHGAAVTLDLSGEKVEITSADVSIEHRAREGTVAQSGRSVTVALTTDLTPELVTEGNARELLSVIQKQRKKLNFEISDKIRAEVWGDDDIAAAVREHGEFISRECLAPSLQFHGLPADTAAGESFDVNGHRTQISLTRV